MMVTPNVCLIFFNADGEVLVSYRRHDHSFIGFPGGKVEVSDIVAGVGLQDHFLRIACARETRQETGLVVWPHDLVEVYRGPCVTPGPPHPELWPTVAFMAREHVGWLKPSPHEPPFRWASVAELVDPDTSPFADYNGRALSAVGLCL